MINETISFTQCMNIVTEQIVKVSRPDSVLLGIIAVLLIAFMFMFLIMNQQNNRKKKFLRENKTYEKYLDWEQQRKIE